MLGKHIVKMITVLVQSQQTERPWGVSKHETDMEVSGGMARGGGTYKLELQISGLLLFIICGEGDARINLLYRTIICIYTQGGPKVGIQ